MSNKVLFLIAVKVPGFDDKSATRRLTEQRSVDWNHMYGLSTIVKNVWCADDYPALQAFNRTFGLLGHDMKILHEFGHEAIATSPRRALGQFLDRGHMDAIVVSQRIGNALRLMNPNIPDLGHSQLYIVVTDGKTMTVTSTEDRTVEPHKLVTPEEFRSLLEGARERIATAF